MWRMSLCADPRLKPFLARGYVGARYVLDEPRGWSQPPIPFVSLIVTLEGPLQVGGRSLPAAWIGGLGGECETVGTGQVHESVDVKLTPVGFFALARCSPRELVGAYVEPGEMFGRAGRLLEEQLQSARTWEQRCAVLDRLLLSRARDPLRPHPLVLEALWHLQRTSGAISIDALADVLGYSRRHLTAVFHEQMGLPPKTMARLIRFQRVCERLRVAPASWADIAAESGYCDQAHLNRDFRELAETTPRRFIQAVSDRPALS
jgi:AraC-like DNA-binding protein